MEVQPPRRKHTEVLTSQLDIAGKRLADVGCGSGSLSHALARRGAEVIGLDISETALRQAKIGASDDGANFAAALGQALPLPGQSFDSMIYFNALHHVPVADMELALHEVARVLRPGGTLYVAEPLAEGPHFSLVRAIEDETEVRAAAYEALRGLRVRSEWSELSETLYTASVAYASFAAFCDSLLAVDDGRRATIEALRASLSERFTALGRQGDKGWLFDQPMRANLFERIA